MSETLTHWSSGSTVYYILPNLDALRKSFSISDMILNLELIVSSYLNKLYGSSCEKVSMTEHSIDPNRHAYPFIR